MPPGKITAGSSGLSLARKAICSNQFMPTPTHRGIRMMIIRPAGAATKTEERWYKRASEPQVHAAADKAQSVAVVKSGGASRIPAVAGELQSREVEVGVRKMDVEILELE